MEAVERLLMLLKDLLKNDEKITSLKKHAGQAK